MGMVPMNEGITQRSTGDGLRVLYVDDPSEIATVSSFVEGNWDGVTILGADRRADARDLLASESFDCVVTELKFATAVSDSLGETPLVLFTETDSTAISDDLLDRVDTLVQKGQESHVRFLLDKIHGVVDSEVTGSEFERVTEQIPDARTEFFLLDSEGGVEWGSVDAERFFPDAVAGTDETDPLHDRLVAASTDEYGYGAELATAVVNESPVERVGLEIPRESPPTEADTVTYSCWSYPLPHGRRLEAYRDVTAQVGQAERLDRFEQLVELASDGLYMLDADGRYTFVTERYAEMLGYERAELIGRHASAVMNEGALRKGQQTVTALLNDPERDSVVIDQPHVRKDGTTVQLSIHFTVVTDEDGSYAGLMSVARDVTERREREQELAEYEAVFETVRDRVYVLDEDGTIRHANDPFADLFGLDREQIEGRHGREVFGTDGFEAIERTRASLGETGDEHGATELALTDASGNRIPSETYISQLPSAGVVGVIRDISERVQRKQQVAVLDRVLRHNLRNELNVVLGHTELLADRVEEENEELLEVIQERSNKLMEFAEKARRAQQVLDHTVSKSTDQVAVSETVTKVIDVFREKHPGAIITNNMCVGPDVTVPRSVRIALSDLIDNAISHNDREVACVAVTVRACEMGLEIAVADDGPGIPEHEQEVLTEGTETPLRHGNGIGFWLVHWIVTQHGGELDINSDEDGSTVRMLFPDEPGEDSE